MESDAGNPAPQLSQPSPGVSIGASGIERASIYLLKLASFAALYFAAGRLGRKVDFVRGDTRVFWPQTGVALAGLLLLGLRFWPGIVVGSLVLTLSNKEFRLASPEEGSLFLKPLTELNVSLAAALAAGNTLGALAGAWMLLRLGHLRTALDRVQDIYAFLLFAVILAPVVSATINIGGFIHSQPAAWGLAGSLWWKRWFGHGISNLLVAPALLTWGQRPKSRWPWARIGEAVVLFLSVLWLSLNVFTSQSAIRTLNYPGSFAPFPFVIWAALRFGQRGAATATFVVSAIAVLGLSQHFGPFYRKDAGEALILMQVYLTALALSALFLAAALAERRSAQDELFSSREQLRALTARLESAREEERTKISREVHDELGQQLTGLKMGIRSIEKKLPPEAAGLREKCDTLAQLTDEAVDSVRRIASDLRPGILDDLGIAAALQWQVERFAERSGVPAKFSTNFGDRKLDPARSTALFRILQETLTNVARHANAASVQVKLNMETGSVVLEVMDDGAGMDNTGDDGRVVKTLGLVGIRERAQLLGGSVTVSSATPGTLVRAVIPVSESGAPA